ncbi:MAG: FeoA family protein [Spirochaetota bacterium]
MRISDLQPGERARVAGYDTSSAAYRSKLLAMGLTRGVELRLCRVAPLGDPVEIELRGFRLTLRKDEAAVLRLTTVDG